MNLLSWLFIIPGSIGVGYGLTVLMKKQVQLYRQGEIHRYTGQAAQLIGLGLLLVGVGAVLIGLTGFSTGAVFLGIIGGLGYMALRRWADRLEQGQLNLPSQKGKF
ncbi:MAG: hypothetical protein H6673_12275 [Anaerolineales bacterium]|nr:hypothetical protein [Anaerolineales bacterium]